MQVKARFQTERLRLWQLFRGVIGVRINVLRMIAANQMQDVLASP